MIPFLKGQVNTPPPEKAMRCLRRYEGLRLRGEKTSPGVLPVGLSAAAVSRVMGWSLDQAHRVMQGLFHAGRVAQVHNMPDGAVHYVLFEGA